MAASLLFTAMCLLAVFVSSRLSCFFLPGQSRSLVLLGTIGILPVFVQFQVLLAGSAGHLTALGTLLVSVATALPLLAVKTRTTCLPPKEGFRGEETSCPVWLIALVGALAGTVLFRVIYIRLSYTVDDFSYHAMAPAMWVQAKRIIYAPQNYHAYYPFSPHTFTAWLMLPFHNDGLVSFTGAYWLLLAGIAVFVIAREMGAPVEAAVLVAVCIPLAKEAMRNALTFVGVDVAGMAFILAAVAMFGASLTERRPRSPILLSAVFAGYAVGAKVSFAPMAFVLLVAVLFRRDRLLSGPLYMFFAAITGGFWYLRNIWWTGNPIYPAAIGPLPGGMPGAAFERSKLITWVIHPPNGISYFETLFWEHLSWPYALGIVSLIGLLLAPLLLILLYKRSYSGFPLGLILFLLAITALVAYPFMPFSGTVNDSSQALRVDLRFILAPYALGLLLAASFCALGGHWRRIFTALLVLGIFAGTAMTFIDLGAEHHSGDLVAILSGIGAIGLIMLWRISPIKRIARPSLLFLLAAAALFRIGTFADIKRDINRGFIAYYGGAGKPIGRAWQVLDDIRGPQHIAMFGSGAYMAYPLLGRNFQHTAVSVDQTGRLSVPMHLSGPDNVPPSSDLTGNLLAQNIDIVLVSKWNRDRWPSQYALLEKDRRAMKIYDDGYSAIYALTGKER